MSVHYSSKTENWETPCDFFEQVQERFGKFDLDVCASKLNSKCSKFFTKEQDSLTKEWKGLCWMNPPYGRSISMWMRKAYESSKLGATVVCLVPARTDTNWWHEYAVKGDITFIKGRLKFGGSKHNAPFPSALIVFHKRKENKDD